MKAAAFAVLILIVSGLTLYWYRHTPEPSTVESTSHMVERIGLTTSDNVTIVGDYYAPAAASARGLLLLHMMPAERTSWRAFADKMEVAGWHVLAIDLRGHGQSQGGPSGYQSFSDAEHQASRLDVDAGAEFLKSKGVTSLSFGGASIGANLALQYLAEHAEARAAFLLSPGLEYRGVATEPAARSLRPGQAVYYAASADDAYSADTIRKLFGAAPSGVVREIKRFDTAGHGTTMFEREPSFMDEIAAWLKKVAAAN